MRDIEDEEIMAGSNFSKYEKCVSRDAKYQTCDLLCCHTV